MSWMDELRNKHECFLKWEIKILTYEIDSERARYRNETLARTQKMGELEMKVKNRGEELKASQAEVDNLESKLHVATVDNEMKAHDIKQLTDLRKLNKATMKTLLERFRSVLDEKQKRLDERNKISEDREAEIAQRGKVLEAEKKTQMTIKELKNKNKDLTLKVSALQDTVKVKDRGLVKANLELAALKTDGKKGKDKTSPDEENSHLLTALKEMMETNNHLEKEIRQGQFKWTKTKAELEKANSEKSTLIETVKKLKQDMAIGMPELNDLKTKVKQMESCNKKFKDDLESCMPFIDEPLKLKSRIITLTRHYKDVPCQIMQENKNKISSYNLLMKESKTSKKKKHDHKTADRKKLSKPDQPTPRSSKTKTLSKRSKVSSGGEDSQTPKLTDETMEPVHPSTSNT